jgi:hypothetical protein
MRHDVIVKFADNDEISLHTSDPMPLDDARPWLDREFARLECAVTRLSGKVLFVDKVLAIADAAGAQGFADAAWADNYARAASGALRRPMIRVDVPNATVGF